MVSVTLQSCDSVFICQKALPINLSDHKASGENWLWFLYTFSWRYSTRQCTLFGRSHHELLSKQLALKMLFSSWLLNLKFIIFFLKCDEVFRDFCDVWCFSLKAEDRYKSILAFVRSIRSEHFRQKIKDLLLVPSFKYLRINRCRGSVRLCSCQSQCILSIKKKPKTWVTPIYQIVILLLNS